MCIKRILNAVMPWFIVGIVLLSFIMLCAAGIKSCSQDPRIKFGEHVKVTQDSHHLDFYDECTGFVKDYANEGRYEIEAKCVTYHERDGINVVLPKDVTIKVHKDALEVID